MIRMKLASPHSYGLWDEDKLMAECHFAVEDTTALITGFDVHGEIEGLNPYDALLRATVFHLKPLGIDAVVCRSAALFEPLLALRFLQGDGFVSSTPEEVLRHLCPS